MIISDKALRDRIIQDPQEVKQAKQWWEKGEWDKIGNKIVIDPFKNHAIGVCSYDLSVGGEYVSLRDPYSTKQLKKGEHISIGPGETALILTEEYICLPKSVAAIVIPRATWIFEGTSICTSRVEPTWYGKLLIGFTNLAKNPVALERGEEFCTCYFMETSEAETQLTPDRVRFLGRTKIGTIKFTHARQQKPILPDKVTQDDMDTVVDLYGWPWDVIRGMFVLNRKMLGDWIEKEVSSDIVDEATSAAVKTAFDRLDAQYREQIKWVRNLIIGLLTILGTAVIGFLIKLFT